MRWLALCAVSLAFGGVLAPKAAVADEAAAWAALRAGGHVVLIRHASTIPGIGDPPNFSLADCSTQRTLSDAGRAESRRIGERFRSEGVKVERVFTSPWCRCRDTAREAFGKAEDWAPLGSFFENRGNADDQTESVRKRIGSYSSRKPAGTIVMVTHQVNIGALTGQGVGMGEMVVVRPDGCCSLKVVGRIRIS